MLRRITIHFLVQLFVLVMVGVMVTIPALILMGGIGGTAMGIVPEFTFGFLEDTLCPEGTLTYYSIRRSYHEPGESEPHLECVHPDGSRQGVLLPGIFSVLGTTFLASFGLLLICGFIPLSIVAFILTRKAMMGRKNRTTG